MDVLQTFRRALALCDQRTRRRLLPIAILTVATAGLDLLGILLLVPFLSFLGPGGLPQGSFVQLAEDFTGTTDPEAIVLVLALAAAVLFVVKGVTSVVLLWIRTTVLNSAQVVLSDQVLSAFTDATWLEQQEATTGSLLRVVSNSVQLAIYVVGAAITLSGEAAVLVAVMVALVIVNPALALATVLFLIVAGMAYLRIVRKPIARQGLVMQQQVELMNSALIELVGGVKELVVRGTTHRFKGRAVGAVSAYLDAGRFITVVNQSMRYILEALLIIGAAGVVGFAAVTGSTTTVLVSIGVLLAGGFRILPALNGILFSSNTIRSYEPAVAVVEATLADLTTNAQAMFNEDRVMTDESLLSGSFTFDSVTFRYPSRSDAALRDVSVKVEFGESIGIAGASGSGKSTFVDLLLGLLDPTSGDILVDGKPLRACLSSWRSGIGFVSQDIFLADDTLAANIAFGRDEDGIDADRLARCLRIAHLESVIAELPEGLGTVLGERGIRLSGGQRQRVGLARALYLEPRVLILDEATSALDNETERAISDALRELHGELTMVVIAHRLSTVRSCDRIIYLDGGAVSGIGTFDELAARNAGFSRLVELGSLRGTF